MQQKSLKCSHTLTFKARKLTFLLAIKSYQSVGISALLISTHFHGRHSISQRAWIEALIHVPCVRCQMSGVICPMSHVLCHMSLTPTATATDLPPANSPAMQSRMRSILDPFWAQIPNFETNVLSFVKRHEQNAKKCYNIATDNTTLRLNRPSAWFSEKKRLIRMN